MSKPQKPKTSGLSAGPTAYWDSISDAKKDAKIEQLREETKRLQAKVDRLTSRGFQDLTWENDELQAENTRLREENERLMNAMESAWGLLADAKHRVGPQFLGWQSDFKRCELEWHASLARNGGRNE
ncbi:MAG: hypothetical protein ACR2M9_01885 [Cyanophyceae cyanobacterium]